jgi:hypothetical protein
MMSFFTQCPQYTRSIECRGIDSLQPYRKTGLALVLHAIPSYCQIAIAPAFPDMKFLKAEAVTWLDRRRAGS